MLPAAACAPQGHPEALSEDHVPERVGNVILVVGLIIYVIRAWRGGEWPFGEGTPVATQMASGD